MSLLQVLFMLLTLVGVIGLYLALIGLSAALAVWLYKRYTVQEDDVETAA